MGWRLIRHVMDHAPDDLTPSEYAALLVLANAAWDTGQRARRVPGIEGNAELLRRLRLPSRSRRFEVIAGLVAKGALERVERGRHGTGATYAIPDYEAAKGPGFPDASSASPNGRAGREGSGISGRRVRDFRSKGPGFPVEGSGISGRPTDKYQTTTRPGQHRDFVSGSAQPSERRLRHRLRPQRPARS